MSSRLDGQKGGRKAFLSAHRCPDADLLPQHETQAPPTLVPTKTRSELTCKSEYLDILSTGKEETDDEGGLSDWSEEDLSLHFSPSVILSDNEESDPESGFECVDVTMETQVQKREGGDLKMVPKRQIQLRKKEEDNTMNQVMPNRSTDREKGLTKELLRSREHHRQDPLLRQHSVPASFHTCSKTAGDANNRRFYRGLVAGASPGLPVGGNSRHLQKSLSVDETKTKMASCIIKNVLSKKMQVEQSNSTTNHLKKRSEVLAAPPQPAEETVGTGKAVLRAPVHTVRDLRSLVKHTYGRPFPTKPDHEGPASFKMNGREESPPRTYQQVLGVKGHVAMVTASFSKSQKKKQSDLASHLITQRRRCSEPISSRAQSSDTTCPAMTLTPPTTLTEFSQSGRAVTSPPAPSRFIQPPPPRKPPLTAPEQRPLLCESSPSSFTMQVLHPCFYTHTTLHTFTPPLHPHLGKASFVHGPLSSMPPPPGSALNLLQGSEDNQNRSTESSSDQPDRARASGGQGGCSRPVKPEEQQPHLQQPPCLWSFQGFLPAQACDDTTGPAAAPGALLSATPSCPLMFDPKSGQCFYSNTPPQPQRKMLLDPETGHFIQVLLPAASSAFNATILPVHYTKPTPTVLHVVSANPTVLSVMAVSQLYSPPSLPITMTTSAAP